MYVFVQLDGMLPRRGTTVEFYVRFKPNGPTPAPKLATLVRTHAHTHARAHTHTHIVI
jgi:hypothetical protein